MLHYRINHFDVNRDEAKNKERLLSPEYCILILCNLIAHMGFAVSTSMVAPYAATIGAEASLLGLITGTVSLMSLIVRPLSGAWSDFVDKKKMLLITYGCLAVIFWEYSRVDDLAVLFVIRVFHGIAFAFCTTLTLSVVADVISAKRYASGLGYFGLTTSVATAIAPSIGAFLVKKQGYTGMFRFVAALYPMAVICLLFMRYPKRSRQGMRLLGKGFLRNLFAQESIPVALIGFFNSFTNGAVMAFILVFAADKQIENASLFFVFFAGATLLCRPFIGRIADAYEPKVFVYPCGLVIIATMLILFLTESLPMLLLASILFGIGYGGLQPIIQSMCLRCVSPERRGVASGTYYFGLDGGNALGPIFCSTLAGMLGGYEYGFLALIIPVLCGFVVMHIINVKKIPV